MPWSAERKHLQLASAGSNPKCLNTGAGYNGCAPGPMARAMVAAGTFHFQGLRGILHHYKRRNKTWETPLVSDDVSGCGKVTHAWCWKKNGTGEWRPRVG